MAMTVTIVDETTSGERTGELTLDFLTERVTAREIIRSRVYQEVTEYNAGRSSRATNLVQPTADERLLNGEKPAERPRIDWQRQYDRALRAFASNGFLLLVGERQLIDLDEEVELRVDTPVTFLKLVPLVGG